MTSVSAGHIILTSTQPIGSGRPQRGSNPGPPHHESRALPTELPRPRELRETQREGHRMREIDRQRERQKEAERERQEEAERERNKIVKRQTRRQTERKKERYRQKEASFSIIIFCINFNFIIITTIIIL